MPAPLPHNLHPDGARRGGRAQQTKPAELPGDPLRSERWGKSLPKRRAAPYTASRSNSGSDSNPSIASTKKKASQGAGNLDVSDPSTKRSEEGGHPMAENKSQPGKEEGSAKGKRERGHGTWASGEKGQRDKKSGYRNPVDIHAAEAAGSCAGVFGEREADEGRLGPGEVRLL